MSMFLENMSTFLGKEIVFSNFQIFEVWILRQKNTHSQCVFFLAVYSPLVREPPNAQQNK